MSRLGSNPSTRAPVSSPAALRSPDSAGYVPPSPSPPVAGPTTIAPTPATIRAVAPAARGTDSDGRDGFLADFRDRGCVGADSGLCRYARLPPFGLAAR